MGLLTNSAATEGGPIKLLANVRKWSSLFCAFLYVSGLAYFGVLHWPSFHGSTYFSENALLPGLVDEEFMHSKTLATYAREVKKQMGSTKNKQVYMMPHERFQEKFMAVGLESYAQNFTVHLPLAGVKKFSGTNVFGILRAPRSSSSEAIIVSVPYRMNGHNLIGLIFTLAEFCRAQIYWAKDIIFVIAEHEDIGMEAWLAAYHHRKIANLVTEPLMSRGGAIQAGISVEIGKATGPYSHADIRYHMVNGQLPNLDLINLVVRMAEKEALQATVFKQEETHYPFSYEGFLRLLSTSLRGLSAQALCRPTGLHGVFGRYGIEAVTLEPYQKGKNRLNDYQIGLEEVGRVLEGTLRSLNNLLERFHQSFFFYVLPSSHRYISIGLYMPAIGLMALAPLLKACCLWSDMVDTSTAMENGEACFKPIKKEDHSFLSVAPSLIVAHLIGVFMYCFPSLLMGYEDSGEVTVNGIVGITVAVFFLPFMLKRKYRHPDTVSGPSPLLMRTVLLILLGLLLGVSGVLNFGLGFMLCVVTVPVSLICRPRSNLVGRTISSIVLVLTNPLVFVALLNLSQFLAGQRQALSSISVTMIKTYELTKLSIVNVVADSVVHQSWLYAMISLCLVPMWTLFWTLIHL